MNSKKKRTVVLLSTVGLGTAHVLAPQAYHDRLPWNVSARHREQRPNHRKGAPTPPGEEAENISRGFSVNGGAPAAR